MASRMRATTVSERPRTSSGQTSKFFDKPISNKRVSRDDLTLALKGSGRGHMRAYHVPGRGRLPSPDTSPRSEFYSRTTVVRTATPESLDDRDHGLIAIGMALGSPSQAPEHMPAPWNTPSAVAAAFDIPEPLEDVQTKPKAKKWGIFSRSKSKRGRPENRPKRSMTDISNPSNTSISSGAGSLAAAQGMKGSLDQSARKTPKHKPIVIRSQTDPGAIHQAQPEEPKPSRELNRKASTKSLRGESPTSRLVEEPLPSPIPPVPQLSGPFLDIQIPSVTMERYSIMFGSVLQTQASSGLLARRQANLDCLMTIKDEISRESGEELPRPRRATSPQPRNSPTFSLFPQTPRGVKPNFSQMPSPRLRSNTSPALLPSPSQATFEEGKVMRREPLRAKVVQVGGGKDSRRETDTGPRPMQLVSKFNKQPSLLAHETSNLVESPEVDSGSFHIHHGDSRKTTSTERVRPTPSVSIASTSSNPEVPEKLELPLSKTTSNSSNSTAHAEVDPDQAFRNAVEISIARQISVSRQQRKMLRPLQRQQSWRTPTNSSANSVVSDTLEEIPVGKNERLSQTKTATPRLVNPRNLLGSPDELLVNRKSELVILEGP